MLVNTLSTLASFVTPAHQGPSTNHLEQMLWVWTVSLPITILNCPAVANYDNVSFGRPCDIIGVVLFAYGFLLEAIADIQKYRFRSVVQKSDKTAICDTGVWAWSRHPNYL